MSLPEVQEVRRRIEACHYKPYRMYLMSLYLCGAARSVEMAGKRCSGERQDMIYGPKGSDVFLTETPPPDPTWLEVLEMLLSVQTGEQNVKDAIAKAKQRIKVAVFKVKIAKQHLEENEEPPFRLVALPMPKQYEPWTEELYNYFHDLGNDYVFPFNRQTVWHYITNVDPIFQGLTYRIKKYTFMKTGQPICKVLPHPRDFKLHALRHVRTDELIRVFGFDGIDLGAYVGWSMGNSKQVSNMPSMAGNYAEIREAWYRYIKKLCVAHV
jgi:hypothetical protein